jgi:hypothetical protein
VELAQPALRWAAGSFIFCEAAAFREAAASARISTRAKKSICSSGSSACAAEAARNRHPAPAPAATSDRKAHLYTRGEHFRFMLKTLLLGGRNLRSRESCYAWYDGRR